MVRFSLVARDDMKPTKASQLRHMVAVDIHPLRFARAISCEARCLLFALMGQVTKLLAFAKEPCGATCRSGRVPWPPALCGR